MIFDTRDMGRALSSTTRLNLGFLATLYDDPGPWKEGEGDDAKGLIFTRDAQALGRYNAEDCVRQRRVFDGMRAEREWRSRRVQKLYAQHTETARIAATMHWHGVGVDRRVRARLARELWALYEDRKTVVAKLARIRPRDRAAWKCSPGFMRSFLFRRYAKPGRACIGLEDPLDPDAYTDQGVISVDKAQLLRLLTQPALPEPAAEVILAYWAAEAVKKARGTYVVSAKVDHAIGPDGRLHPGWNSCGADTGRWSCSDPNIQNLSAEKDEEDRAGPLPNMRAMYRAAPGSVIVHGDISQAELRCMAIITGDEKLLKRLESGDVHAETARAWFRLPRGAEVKPQARKRAKNIRFAGQYGAGASTVWSVVLERDRSITYEETAALLRAFHVDSPRLLDYWRTELALVEARGYSQSRILHRRRNYAAPPTTPDVANYPVQSTVADIANDAIVRLDQALRGIPNARIVMQHHDALDVECRAKDGQKVAALMKETLEGPYRFCGGLHRFPAAVKLGVRWSDV